MGFKSHVWHLFVFHSTGRRLEKAIFYIDTNAVQHYGFLLRTQASNQIEVNL